MPTPTYIPLATYTVAGSSDASVEFTSIPASYRDLILVLDTKSDASGCVHFLRFNGVDSGAYNEVRLSGNGSITYSDTTSGTWHRTNVYADVPTTGSHVNIIQIMDYSQTDRQKPTVMRSATASQGTDVLIGRFGSTAAISSIRIFANVGSYAIGSTFSLYGVN